METRETGKGKGSSDKTIQKGITKVTKSTKVPVKGALWIFNPVGSSYKDPDTKDVVIREEATLQYAKSGVPQKYGLGLQDMKNFEEFFNSKEWQEIKDVLPDVATLEPKTV